MTRSNIALRIKEIRKQQKLSQNRFGFKIGVSGKSISAYENGRCNPPLKILERISKAYETPLMEFDYRTKTLIENKIVSIKEFLGEIENIIYKNGTI